MGLITVGLIAFIIIMGFVFAYLFSRDQLFPPYQEPVTPKQDVDENWPFPKSRP